MSSEDYCLRCGGKLKPHTSLHVDPACNCEEMDRIQERRWEERKERKMERHEDQKKNRKTFVIHLKED